MNIHSSPVISGTAPPPANERNDRLTNALRIIAGAMGKTRVDGSTAGQTDRPTGIKGVAPPVSLQVLLQLQCKLLDASCNLQLASFNL